MIKLIPPPVKTGGFLLHPLEEVSPAARAGHVLVHARGRNTPPTMEAAPHRDDSSVPGDRPC